MITSLASLFSLIHEQTLIEHFLSKSRMQVQSADGWTAESLLSWDTVNRLLESDQLPPSRVKLVRANMVIPPMNYRGGNEASE